MQKYNLEDLRSNNPDVKYATQRLLIKLSETDPESLYSDFDAFVELLNDKNNILKWTGILVLGNLSKVDKGHKIEHAIPLLISKLNEGKMITANNTIKSLTTIAKNIPEMADKIALEILKVKEYKYDTQECSYIAQGQVLVSLKEIWNLLSNDVKNAAIEFARSNLNCPRNATSKKAQGLINSSM